MAVNVITFYAFQEDFLFGYIVLVILMILGKNTHLQCIRVTIFPIDLFESPRAVQRFLLIVRFSKFVLLL